MSRAVRFVICTLLSTGSLLAAGAAAAQAWPAPIHNLQDKGVTIVEQFDAPGGLTGFAAKAGGQSLALYLTPDGEHVIVGTLLDADGNNLSQPKLDAAITAPSRENAWPRLKKSTWIGDGDPDAPRKVFVFTDPNCPYCHKFYNAARPWVKAGKVQLRHIPVGVLKPSSQGKAAALLAADDPEAAMRRHENRFRRGGIQPMKNVPDALRDELGANKRLMAQMGVRGTPGIIYKDDSGSVQVQPGLPQGAALTRVLGPK